jgi:MFS transporter, YNFM family, putative membrane transport protein
VIAGPGSGTRLVPNHFGAIFNGPFTLDLDFILGLRVAVILRPDASDSFGHGRQPSVDFASNDLGGGRKSVRLLTFELPAPVVRTARRNVSPARRRCLGHHERSMTPPRERLASGPAAMETQVLVMLGIFGMVTSLTMVAPLLVDLSREFRISVGTAGLLAAASAVPQALASPFAGVLSDRFGRRPMIVAALAAVGAFTLAGAAAPFFMALVVLRVLAGLLGSCGPTSLMASVGDLFPLERRSQAMAWFNMGFGLAAIAGVPVVGALAGLLGWRAGFAITGLGLLVLAALVRLRFPASRLVSAELHLTDGYRAVLGAPGLLSFLSANFIERSMYATIILYFPAFLMQRYRLTMIEVAPLLAIVAGGTLAGSFFGGWLGDRFSKPVIFITSQIVAGVVGLLLFDLDLRFATAVLLAVVVGLANAASRPGFLAYGSELAPARRGALFGLMGLTNQGGLGLGSVVGALAIAVGSYEAVAIVVACQGFLASTLASPLLVRKPPGPVAEPRK